MIARLITVVFLVGCLNASAAAQDAANAWEVRPVLVGTTIPDVSFVGQDGKPFSVRERAKEKPLILVVYRGLW